MRKNNDGSILEPIDPDDIPGLVYLPGFIDPAQDAELIRQLDEQPWEEIRRGRVQNYGYTFSYQNKGSVDRETFREPPAFLQALSEQLVERDVFPNAPECLIVNDYEPGQGIVPHVDMKDEFGPKVCTLSLLAPIAMVFINLEERERRGELILEPGSLVTMEGEARYDWMHGIRGRKQDRIDGEMVARRRRVSVSFRNVIRA